MNFQATFVSIALFALMSTALAQDEGKGPRTGFFETEMTVLELLGEEGAASLSDVFDPDEKLKWKIYVPKTYTPAKPAGVIVYVTFSNSWGGSKRTYNDVLDDRNLIWAGVVGAGDKKPMNTRIMRALLTPTFLARNYVLDPERMFVGGTSGGAQVAAILATSKPHLFKGALFVGEALAWKDKMPAGIEQVRKNRYVFMVGSNNTNLKLVQGTAATYREAGIETTKLIVMPNVARKAPTASFIKKALEYLDGQGDAKPDE